MVASKTDVPWRRQHDPPGHHLTAATVYYPTGLRDLIEICTNPTGNLRAAGSHYALSGAAISDDTFIETNDPREEMPAMARTLHDVLPGCISDELLDLLKRWNAGSHYPIHVEAGKRLYQLYSELDWGVARDERSLAYKLAHEFNLDRYTQSWAIPTMGSAAQQTIVGAFSTGTHGGDVDLPPVADAILAIHLVVDGGRHFWIERVATRPFGGPIVDDAKLKTLYSEEAVGREVEIVRSNAMFDAVLVSAGRFGVIYSVVVAAVPQFDLHESTELATWQDVKGQIAGGTSRIWKRPDMPAERTRFLNIVVSLSPIVDGSANRVGIIRRWETGRTSGAGIAERRGDPSDPPFIDERTGSVFFPMAGRSREYSGKPEPSMIESACAAAGFIEGLIAALLDEIEQFVESNGAIVGAGIAAVALAGGGGLILLIPALALLVIVIRAFLEEFDFDDSTIGDVAEAFREAVMGVVAEVGLPAPVFVWRLFTDFFFRQQMDREDREAVSYAIMDTHDYRDRSCFVDVDSLEVFFDGDNSKLTAYVDSLIAFEKRQQGEGLTFFGVAALRFMRRTRATIGPQRWAHTASVEVAGLSAVDGTRQLMRYASLRARDLDTGGFLHWGQRNDTTAAWLSEFLHGDGSYGRWQGQLLQLTDGGRLDRFSSRQTRSWGLEVP